MCLNGICQLLVYLGVLVVQGSCCAVLHRRREVVHGDVPSERPRRDVVVGEERRTRESDSGRGRQELAHVRCENPVVGSTCLVAEDHDVVVGRYGINVGIVGLLDEGEDEARVALELANQVLAARGDVASRVGRLHAAAVGEGARNLLVELVMVRHHDERGRPRELAQNLPRQKHHGVALAGVLRMPEDAEFPVLELAVSIGLHRPVDAGVLVVACKNLGRRT